MISEKQKRDYRDEIVHNHRNLFFENLVISV